MCCTSNFRQGPSRYSGKSKLKATLKDVQTAVWPAHMMLPRPCCNPWEWSKVEILVVGGLVRCLLLCTQRSETLPSESQCPLLTSAGVDRQTETSGSLELLSWRKTPDINYVLTPMCMYTCCIHIHTNTHLYISDLLCQKLDERVHWVLLSQILVILIHSKIWEPLVY